MADGPSIQLSSQRALKSGMNIKKCLSLIKIFREKNIHTPLILMGYYNPIYKFGKEKFIKKCIEFGVDALIIVDLPPEEDDEFYFEAEKWYIISAILTPIGYVIQDVVADAMTVEAVEGRFKKSNRNNKTIKLIKKEHTLLQMYGRFAIILGSLIVSIINLSMFNNVDISNKVQLNNTYANIYFYSLYVC